MSQTAFTLFVRRREGICNDCLLMGRRGSSCPHTYGPASRSEIVSAARAHLDYGAAVEAAIAYYAEGGSLTVEAARAAVDAALGEEEK